MSGRVVLAVVALVLAVLHPWLVLAVELAVLAVLAAGIARSAGVSIRTPWRYP